MPYEFIGNSDFFREPLVKDVISFLKIALNPIDSNIEIARVLQRKQASIRPVEVKRFSRFAHKNKLSLYEAFGKIEEMDVDKDKFGDIKKKLEEIVSKKNTLKLPGSYKILFELTSISMKLFLITKNTC